ncbi:MAG: PH domain-containing protein [Candidatus Bathyarchaeia archaeon]
MLKNMMLEAKEKIIFKVHPHWVYVAFPEFLLTIFGFILFKLVYPLPYWIQIVSATALILTMLMVLLDWLCINYYLTNLRLIEERGIIGKRIMMVPLNKVQDITCRFGILGRIFGFGDLEIESAGTYGKIIFNFIANPRKRKEEINEALLKIKENESNMKRK